MTGGAVNRADNLLQVHRGWVTVAAAGIPVAACWVLSLTGDAMNTAPPAIALVLPVVAAAATGNRLAGFAAAVSAAASFDFFLTPPVHTFRIADPVDIEVAVLLLVVGFAVSELAIWGRRQQARASREQGYLDGLVGTAGAVAAGRMSRSDLVELVRNQIMVLLRLDACRFDTAREYGLPTLDPDGRLRRGGRTVDVGRVGLPTDTSFTVPARSGGAVYGHYVLTAATQVLHPTREQLRVVVVLADQVGAAMATIGQRADPVPPARDRSADRP